LNNKFTGYVHEPVYKMFVKGQRFKPEYEPPEASIPPMVLKLYMCVSVHDTHSN